MDFLNGGKCLPVVTFFLLFVFLLKNGFLERRCYLIFIILSYCAPQLDVINFEKDRTFFFFVCLQRSPKVNDQKYYFKGRDRGEGVRYVYKCCEYQLYHIIGTRCPIGFWRRSRRLVRCFPSLYRESRLVIPKRPARRIIVVNLFVENSRRTCTRRRHLSTSASYRSNWPWTARRETRTKVTPRHNYTGTVGCTSVSQTAGRDTQRGSGGIARSFFSIIRKKCMFFFF